MSSDSSPWPDVPRVCFSSGEWDGVNASIGWVLRQPRGGIYAYVEGYRRAAEALFEHVTRHERVSPEYVVFPLAFLWRHHIELALKEIIARGKGLDGYPERFPNHHRLGDLWQEALPHIVVHGDPLAPELANVEANITEFDRIDPFATGFRYSLDRTGSSTGLSNTPPTVSIAAMQDAMTAVSNFLDAVRSCQERAEDSLML